MMQAKLLATFGDDLMVVNTARVSMSKRHKSFDPDSDTSLIRYLAREGHWSTFSHPKAQFSVHMPIFTARQWEKHRVGSTRAYDIYDHNEVSRRYIDSEPEFYAPEVWRSRPAGNIKQGSGAPLPDNEQSGCRWILTSAYNDAKTAYRDLLDSGVAPEQARMVLPQSMYTTWIETGSLYYWSRLCLLRLDDHAQQEIRMITRQIYDAMAEAFPVSWNALMLDVAVPRETP